MTGPIITTSVDCRGGNGDHIAKNSSNNETWRIWKEQPTSNSFAPRYRAFDNSNNSIFAGYFAITEMNNTRILKIGGTNAGLVKQNELLIGWFWPYAQSMSTVPVFTVSYVRYSDNTFIYNYDKGGDSKWAVTVNGYGTVNVTYNGSASIDGVAILMSLS